MEFTDYLKKFGRVGVLMGGYSSEREISLKSGSAIYQALQKLNMDVVPLDIVERDKEKIKAFIQEAGIAVAFIALHGELGEDGKIQALLEEMDIRYTGSGVKSSRLAINKAEAQKYLKRHAVKIPENFCVSQNQEAQDFIHQIEAIGGFPVVVKPSSGGSSIGINIVSEHHAFSEALGAAWQYCEDVLVEKFIKGREFTVSILDKKTLPVIEIRHQSAFFDFRSKYESQETQYITPAKISPILAGTLQSVALKAYRVLNCADFGRVDLLVDEDLNHYVLEVNTIPGFTETSLLPKAALESGINFEQLCLKILETAYGKKKENNENKSVYI